MNEIWMLLFITVLVTIVLLVKFRSKLTWWEIPLIWGVSIITIFVCQFTYSSFSSNDVEYWGFNSVRTYYDEPYEYWTTCQRQCGETCTTSNGVTSCTPVYCSYPCTEWAGDKSYLVTQTGNNIRISNDYFNNIAKNRWKNNREVELNREKSYDIETDGDRWVSDWPKTYETAIPIVEKHTYENKVNSSSSIYFRPVSEKDKEFWKLYDYIDPNSGMQSPTILDKSNTNWGKAQTYFAYVNGIIGPYKFCRIWVLIFENADRSVADWQKDYWKNGNKNEIIICIGVNKTKDVQWGSVFGWTHSEQLKVKLKDYVEQKLIKLSPDSLFEFAKIVESGVKKEFVKPEFTDEYAYLAVEPSMTAKIIIGIIILLSNIGIAMYAVLNQFTGEVKPRSRYDRYRK